MYEPDFGEVYDYWKCMKKHSNGQVVRPPTPRQIEYLQSQGYLTTGLDFIEAWDLIRDIIERKRNQKA